MAKLRDATVAWFGGLKRVTITGARKIHWLEARVYIVTNTSGSTRNARLPYNVKGYCAGGPLLIVHNNASSTHNVQIQDGNLSAVTNGLLTPGSHAYIFLEDSSTQYGTWRVLQRSTSSRSVPT